MPRLDDLCKDQDEECAPVCSTEPLGDFQYYWPWHPSALFLQGGSWLRPRRSELRGGAWGLLFVALTNI